MLADPPEGYGDNATWQVAKALDTFYQKYLNEIMVGEASEA